MHDRDFFVDLPGTLSVVAAHLGLPPPDPGVTADARAHLDPSLRHHVAPAVDSPNDNPLVALAARVWNLGSVDLDAVSGAVAEAIRWGWLRPPIDGELLARSRAQAVELRDRIRQRRRQEIAARKAPPSKATSQVQPAPVSVVDGSGQPEDVDE